MLQRDVRSGSRSIDATLRRSFKHAARLLLAATFALSFALVASCATEESEATPTLRPTRVTNATPTPNLDEVSKARVAAIFASQVAAIQAGDWASVYPTCSPQFRAARDVTRFVRDASGQFARDGYTVEGFEARNIEPSVRAPDRVRVKWDAYQDGSYVRTEEVGQIYVFTQGDWFDDGAWCR